MEPFLALVFAFAMAAIHFLAEELEELMSTHQERLISFTSGVSITYIFVQLLPEFQKIASETSDIIFIAPLLGFSSIHLAEKYVAKKEYSKELLVRRYGEIHSVFLFFYHGLIGFLVASLLGESTASGTLFFIPIMLHIGVSSFSLSELHEDIARDLKVKLAISGAPILGVLTHNFGIISEGFFQPLFGLVLGMFTYVVIRDGIPQGDGGKPVEYVLGLIIYLLIILAVNAI